MTPIEKAKQKIWHFIYKFFPTIQRGLLRLHLIWHEKWGFGNHFVAWGDTGQVLSWRKLSDFNHQYHLRVFSDGEIRGHFEYTPEGHPVAHFDEKGEAFHRGEFLKFLGDFVTEKRHHMHLEADPNAYNPNSEISIESLRKV